MLLTVLSERSNCYTCFVTNPNYAANNPGVVPPHWITPAPGLPPRPDLPAYNDNEPPPLLPPGSAVTFRQVLKAVFGEPQQPRSVGGEFSHLTKAQREIEKQQNPPDADSHVSLALPGDMPPSVYPIIPPAVWQDRDASRPVLPTAVPNAVNGMPPTPTRFIGPDGFLFELTPGSAMFGRLF